MSETLLGQFENTENILKEDYQGYSMLLSHYEDRSLIMNISLPIANSVGIDLYENGRHILDYTYNTFEESLKDLNRFIWDFFKPKNEWTQEQIMRYTENWLAKSNDVFDFESAPVHSDYSYVHHPELIGLPRSEAIFKAIGATVLKEVKNLRNLIKITNDLTRDLGDAYNASASKITRKGILSDQLSECHELLNQIDFEIEACMDNIESILNIKIRSIQDDWYRRAFNKTAFFIYQKLTGRQCPNPLKVDRWTNI